MTSRRLLWIGPMLPWGTVVLLLAAANRPGAALTQPAIGALAAASWLVLLGVAALTLPPPRWGRYLAFLWLPGLETVLAIEGVSAAQSALVLGAALWAVCAVIGAVAAAVMRSFWLRRA